MTASAPALPRTKGRAGRPLSADHVAAAIGLLLIVTLTLIAIFAPLIAPYDPTERVGKPFQVPSAAHPLGTNDIGQDILSELIFGTRVSLVVGASAALISIFIGTTVGLFAGYYDKLGMALMRVVDIILVLPFLPLLILLAAYVGRSMFNTVLVIGLLSWAGTARVIRAHVMSCATHDYVLAARAVGARNGHILLRHLLPQVMLLAVGQFVEATSAAILLEASLSFLGLGDPLQKSWGTILYWAQVRGAFLTPAWLWWVLPPGLMIVAASLGFALLGFALEQILNPRLRK
jgi:peptide/nickel transport system ATP-binding protein/peptide/nickel transport system permease protein